MALVLSISFVRETTNLCFHETTLAENPTPMSAFTREFLFYLAELQRYDQCHPRACSDKTAHWLWYRIRSDAVLLIGETC
jgi:hypothetical protein